MNSVRITVCGGREVQWTLVRKGVRNVNLRIKPDGSVWVSAAPGVPIWYIENFLREKADFIFSAQEKFAEKSSEPELPAADGTYRDGDTLRFLGKDYTLRIIESAEESVTLGEKEIFVKKKSPDNAGILLVQFYKTETQNLFNTLNFRTCLMFRARGYPLEQAELQIRDMLSQWGSCHIADRKIVMNSRLMLYPEVCAAYVFVHEYAHFVVPNHSPEFYKVVSDIMPDYKFCKDLLKK